MGEQVEIVGIMPPKFVFPDPETRLLVPLWLNPQGIFGDFGTSTLARLAPGITLEAARQEMDALQRRIPERFKISQKLLDGWRWSVTVEPLRDSVVGDMSKPLWILFGVRGACAAHCRSKRGEPLSRPGGISPARAGSEVCLGCQPRAHCTRVSRRELRARRSREEPRAC